MSIKKKLGMGVLTAALGVSLIGGGTFAYFSDETTSLGNQLTSGTVNISPGDQYIQKFDIDGWKPGDKLTATVQNQSPAIILNNQGTLPFDVVMQVESTSTHGLKDVLRVNHLQWKGNDLLPDIRSAAGLSSGDDVTLADLEAANDDNVKWDVDGLHIGELGVDTGSIGSLTYELEFVNTGAAQNHLQGDVTEVDFMFVALQKDGTDYDHTNLDNNNPGGGGTYTPTEDIDDR